MNATYHLNSAEDINSDILDAIKTAFKSKPITITIEEDNLELNADLKLTLDERLQEDETTYLTADESIIRLKGRYGL
ncbi:MAG: hypothetical protein PHV20_11190 [Bacteroidales bacterium]|nr:hypothetical protein [Bacteroidales bacterium]